jgi:hypothetical protein
MSSGFSIRGNLFRALRVIQEPPFVVDGEVVRNNTANWTMRICTQLVDRQFSMVSFALPVWLVAELESLAIVGEFQQDSANNACQSADQGAEMFLAFLVNPLSFLRQFFFLDQIETIL